jgi:hypothetical protein
MKSSVSRTLILSLAITSVAPAAEAQTRLAPGSLTFMPPAADGDTPDQPLLSTSAVAFQVTNRPCDGCPPRRVWRSLFQTTWINVVYGLVNLMRGHDTAKITPETWWDNMKAGWEWDLNDFKTNQFGHPYQGNNYYTAARSNGMNFWEAGAVAAFGSATWEYFGETNDASLNDFINTTLGGIALGEMFHRTAWLIRDPQKTGKGRMWGEIFATAIDPMGGFNRFTTGDAAKVMPKPAEMVPSRLGMFGTVGALWHGDEQGGFSSSEVDPFMEVDLQYGDFKAAQKIPYDAFVVRLGFGGGGGLSETRVRGRVLGKGVKNGSVQLAVAQGFSYNSNNAYQFGSQSFDFIMGFANSLSSSWSMSVAGGGGVTVLGAVNTDVIEEPTEPEDPHSVIPTSRDYDYGPGSNAAAAFNLFHRGRPLFRAEYELHHLHIIDGTRANYLLQRFRADLNVPLRGRLGAGVTGDYFRRQTFYQNGTKSRLRFPEIRVFLSWSVQ